MSSKQARLRLGLYNSRSPSVRATGRASVGRGKRAPTFRSRTFGARSSSGGASEAREARRPVVVPFTNYSQVTPVSNVASVEISPNSGGIFGSRVIEMGDLYRWYRPRKIRVTIYPTLAPDPFFGTMHIIAQVIFGTGLTPPTGIGGFESSLSCATGTFRTTPTVIHIENCRPLLNMTWYETEADGVPSTDTVGVVQFLNSSSATGSFLVKFEGEIEFMEALDPTVSLARLAKTVKPDMPAALREFHLSALGLWDEESALPSRTRVPSDEEALEKRAATATRLGGLG